jgi:hypothetical protein
MHVTQWKEPALSWNGTIAEDGRPAILEVRSDDFIPQFLEAMAGSDPAAYFDDHRLEPKAGQSFMKLYQPLHGCFYLVTASLVCRQLGLPDKAIDRTNGESVFFVIRRRTAGGGEQAWIQLDKGGYWKTLPAGQKLTLAVGEERLPMHPVQICPTPAAPRSVFTDNIERELHYGYIPAGNRDKYRDTFGRTLTATPAPQTLVNDFIGDAEANAPPGVDFNWRRELFFRRVYRPWQSLDENLLPGGSPQLRVEISTNAQIEQLYALLELADFFKNNLPSLWAALEAGSGSGLPAGSDILELYERLTDSSATNPFEIESNGADEMVGDLLMQYKAHIELVRGQGTIPATDLDFRDFFSAGRLDQLRDAVEDAIPDETQPIQVAGDEDSNELVRLITHQVQPREPEGSEATYHIRAVYEYDPECPPIVSPAASHPFTLAKFFEPDAPARLVKLEAPSMKPQDLRKYARGVGIEMSPDLHKLASCLAGGDIDGIIDSISGDCEGGLNIQMICSFSIQIIFMVAFIVMFIFLIMLNFIFGWLAYLRICLPIPVKD